MRIGRRAHLLVRSCLDIGQPKVWGSQSPQAVMKRFSTAHASQVARDVRSGETCRWRARPACTLENSNKLQVAELADRSAQQSAAAAAAAAVHTRKLQACVTSMPPGLEPTLRAHLYTLRRRNGMTLDHRRRRLASRRALFWGGACIQSLLDVGSSARATQKEVIVPATAVLTMFILKPYDNGGNEACGTKIFTTKRITEVKIVAEFVSLQKQIWIFIGRRFHYVAEHKQPVASFRASGQRQEDDRTDQVESAQSGRQVRSHRQAEA